MKNPIPNLSRALQAARRQQAEVAQQLLQVQAVAAASEEHAGKLKAQVQQLQDEAVAAQVAWRQGAEAAEQQVCWREGVWFGARTGHMCQRTGGEFIQVP